ncbi:SPOR domain-containing protein [Prolixibacter bellariivorans]|nr:SPOR domain-containing protein [Prolixibacter bellariivorans]
MKPKHRILNIFLALILLFLLPFNVSAQRERDMEAKAANYFHDQNYQDALPLYKELIKMYPEDEELNYCYGVSMVETEHYGPDAWKALLTASLGRVPADVYFYLGKCFHAESDWDLATKYYQRFADYGRNKDLKRLGLREYMDLCSRKINPFKAATADKKTPKDTVKPAQAQEKPSYESFIALTAEQKKHHPELFSTDEAQSVATENIDSSNVPVSEVTAEQKERYPHLFATEKINSGQESAEDNIPVPVQTKTFSPPAGLDNAWFNFQVNSRIKYHELKDFRTPDGKSIFAKGWIASIRQDSLAAATHHLRKEYEGQDPKNNAELSQKILQAEQLSYKLMREREDFFRRARQEEQQYWDNQPDNEIEQFSATLLKKQEQHVKKREEALAAEQPAPPAPKVNKPVVKKPVVTPASDEIEYRVQIGSFSKGLPSYVQRLYDKLSKFRKIDHYTDDKGVVVYTVGKLSDYHAAVNLKKQLRQEGASDAFVVAYKNGERIKVSDALKIQKGK